MATAKPRGGSRSSKWLGLLVVVAVIGGGAVWYYGEEIAGQSRAGTAFAAKNTCSCRYLAGRDMASCRDDPLPGRVAIWLTEDEAEQSVTAHIPLIDSTTATYREGFGCVLESWDG